VNQEFSIHVHLEEKELSGSPKHPKEQKQLRGSNTMGEVDYGTVFR
jgi:hypothetical protein